MKKILVVLILPIIFMYACKPGKEKEVQGEEKVEVKIKRKITKRNYFIDKTNACNDFFLDSANVVKYIHDEGLPDSIADRMIWASLTSSYQLSGRYRTTASLPVTG